MSNMPSKVDVFRALLISQRSVFIHVNPRESSVIVPSRLKLQDQCVLQVGLDMPVPIPDLAYDRSGVSGTLSFKGVPFKINVPWSAVFALVGEDAKGMVWEQEMPPSIKEHVAQEQAIASGNVTRLDTSAVRKNTSPIRKNTSPAQRGHLRLVK
jgi:stringent starvation protein B